MMRLRWTEDLLHRAKGDPGKIRLARRLRAETSVTLKWIAEHLHMGSWTHVSNRLYDAQQSNDSNQTQLGLV